MPMRTDPAVSPGVRTHSCSAVYFRSSGNTVLLGSWLLGRGSTYRPRSAASARLRITRLRGRVQRRHPDVVAGVDPDLAVVETEVVDEAAREPQRRGESVRIADGVDHEGRTEHAPVDADAAVRILERGLCDHPDGVVDLHRLGARVAELLD